MSTINVLYSAITETFEFQKIDLNPYYADILAGVKKHLDVITFSNLSFGYELKLATTDQVVSSRTWPDSGVTYIQTDQEIIDGERVEWLPNTEYALKVWFMNWGQYYEGVHVFVTPLADVIMVPETPGDI